MKSSAIADITDTVADAWSSGTGVVADVASTAVSRAGELASSAADQLHDVPERVSDLARTRLGTAKPAPSRRPWAMIGLGLVAVLVVVWWLRREPSYVADGGMDGARDDGERAGGGTAASGR